MLSIRSNFHPLEVVGGLPVLCFSAAAASPGFWWCSTLYKYAVGQVRVAEPGTLYLPLKKQYASRNIFPISVNSTTMMQPIKITMS